MQDQASLVIRTRCTFVEQGAAWRCQRCGRRVSKASNKPPIATCGAMQTRTITPCAFDPIPSGGFRCLSCGLEAAPSTPGELPFALCGKPETLRMIQPPRPKHGAGTELKSLLAKIGIQATPNCKCTQRAAIMDSRGIEWCEENIDTIVEWLREEATKRGLPFIDAAGRLLIRRAITNAKRATINHK